MAPSVDARRAAAVDGSLVAARAVGGVVLLAAPGFVARLWLGHRSRAGMWLVRFTGVRDLVLSAGQLRADASRRRSWRRAGGLADLTDAAVALTCAAYRRRAAPVMVAVPAVSSALLTLGQDR